MMAGAALAGKCALLTGSVQGLGLAAAERFAESGCDVVLNGFADADSVRSIRTRLEERFGVRTLYSNADLRRPADIEEMIASAVSGEKEPQFAARLLEFVFEPDPQKPSEGAPVGDDLIGSPKSVGIGGVSSAKK